MTNIADVREMPFDQTGLLYVTAKNIARLVRIGEEMRVDLQWRDLGSKLRGEYRHGDGGRYYDGSGLIVMNTRLQGPQVVTTLGHEIAHAMYGDTASTPQTEERAERVGAAIAVDPARFRRARLAGKPSNSYGLAPRALQALEVTPHADGGCTCYACRSFRQVVMDQLAHFRNVTDLVASNVELEPLSPVGDVIRFDRPDGLTGAAWTRMKDDATAFFYERAATIEAGG